MSSGRRRVQLYGQIVRQIRDREPRHVSLRPEPGPVVADCALEKIGWLLQHGVVSGQEATQKLGEYLAAELDLPAVAAEVKAEEYLAFWEDRGFSSGSLQARAKRSCSCTYNSASTLRSATPLVSIEKNSFGGTGR